MIPFLDGVLVDVDGFGSWAFVARKAGPAESIACDRAWSAIVARLDEDAKRSTDALAVARRFSDE